MAIDLRHFKQSFPKYAGIGPDFYCNETKKHRDIIKQIKIASRLNRANLSDNLEESG